MTGDIEFTANVNLPDGREMYASFRINADHPTATAERFLLDHTEFVQMTVATMLRNTLHADRDLAKSEEVPF